MAAGVIVDERVLLRLVVPLYHAEEAQAMTAIVIQEVEVVAVIEADGGGDAVFLPFSGTQNFIAQKRLSIRQKDTS